MKLGNVSRLYVLLGCLHPPPPPNRLVAVLHQAEKRVEALQRELQQLAEAFDKATRAKTAAVARAEELGARLRRASVLVSSLTGERERWNARLAALRGDAHTSVGSAILCAAFITYAGPFASDARTKFIARQWTPRLNKLHLPCKQGGLKGLDCRCLSPHSHFSGPTVVEQLCKPTQVEEWRAQGLPNDGASTQNAVILTRARRFVPDVTACCTCSRTLSSCMTPSQVPLACGPSRTSCSLSEVPHCCGWGHVGCSVAGN